jgi:hypothetical protein
MSSAWGKEDSASCSDEAVGHNIVGYAELARREQLLSADERFVRDHNQQAFERRPDCFGDANQSSFSQSKHFGAADRCASPALT